MEEVGNEFTRWAEARDQNRVKQAALDLYIWQHNNTGSFTSQLYSLIHKADSDNLHRLTIAFPVHVKVWQEWCDCPTPEAFYIKYDLLSEDNAS